MRRAILALTFTLTALPAGAWLAPNGLSVVDLGNGQMQVEARPGLSAAEAFCVAAQYALRVHGIKTTDRIWRASPVPRAVGQGIAFSLTPQANPGKTGLALLSADDGSVSAGFAANLCDKPVDLR